ncbi:two-component system histidine kinase PnpS [Lysinibacillus odysseyi]|uniref:histidine kinase n=1 Tax=Lysinibacillus odysseyi 34hs-1 = NBRC 100172 TaxID=1220589 RepID=A0A0A3J883_9BACI|nr:HAMP domain-containing sensor histidine kinase [Lysinibacillus odysseyi]KGR83252.1 histidine kinase [Lysinibacillus odysseyi 34hs-1 = NBRC 100172]
MKKSMSNGLFFSFVCLVGIILAVLGFVIGQLFPFYAESYINENTEQAQQRMMDVIEERGIDITYSQEQALLKTHGLQLEDDFITEMKARLAVVLLFILAISFILISIVTKKMIRNFVEPIENVTRTAHELAAGNYRARAFANGPKTVVELRNSINILARNLQDITKIREIEEERLKTLIENMGSALLMIDRGGHVSIVNKVFLERFGYRYEEVQKKSFLSLNLPPELESFIDHVFLTEMPYHKQLEMEVLQEITYKLAYGAPVVGDHGRWLGVVIVMHDVSELVRLEQIRKDFVANVSHELRTPITSIKGFSETLLDGAYKDEGMALSFLEIIHQESNRLQILIQDLLELSKIEQHGFSVDIIPTPLQEVLVRAADLTAQRLEEKNMQFQVEFAKEVVVEGDANRLIQIFTNLIFNAIMYSFEETTVTIRVFEKDKWGVVEIIDEGIGIKKSEIPRVFERFYRVDRARSRDSGGTGLGLAIVKHLVEAHHGKIQVESEVGKGTTMRVMLPLHTP